MIKQIITAVIILSVITSVGSLLVDNSDRSRLEAAVYFYKHPTKTAQPPTVTIAPSPTLTPFIIPTLIVNPNATPIAPDCTPFVDKDCWSDHRLHTQ